MAPRVFVVGFALLLLARAPACQSQGKAVLARDAAEYVLRKFGKEAANEGVESLTRKIERLALKHGDDAYLAVRKIGPRAFRIVEDSGEHGGQAVRLLAHFGDDAVWVVAKPNRLAVFVKYGDRAAEAMIKHGEIAEPLLASWGRSAADALGAVSPRNGRRLAMMAEDGQLARIGRTPGLLEVVARFGDRAMDFVWDNKDALAIVAVLNSFLADPEPYLNGTDGVIGQQDHSVLSSSPAAGPAGSGLVAKTARRPWILGAGVVGLLAAVAMKFGMRRERKMKGRDP